MSQQFHASVFINGTSDWYGSFSAKDFYDWLQELWPKHQLVVNEGNRKIYHAKEEDGTHVEVVLRITGQN